MVARFKSMCCGAVGATMTMIVGACASSGATTTAHRTDCGLSVADSVYAVAGPVYHRGQA